MQKHVNNPHTKEMYKQLSREMKLCFVTRNGIINRIHFWISCCLYCHLLLFELYLCICNKKTVFCFQNKKGRESEERRSDPERQRKETNENYSNGDERTSG